MDLKISVMCMANEKGENRLLAVAFYLLCGSFREPVNSPEKQNHGHRQAWIARSDAHHPQYHDVARGNDQRGNHNDEKGAIHVFQSSSALQRRGTIASEGR